jgi:hypothetical protein
VVLDFWRAFKRVILTAGICAFPLTLESEALQCHLVALPPPLPLSLQWGPEPPVLLAAVRSLFGSWWTCLWLLDLG